MRRGSASVVARALLEELWDMKLPIEPEKFANELGLSVVRVDLGLRSGYFDEDKREIYVNQTEPIERQRLAIAHELGHFCLQHSCSNRNTSLLKWLGEVNPEKERQANQFAADLLMPAIAMKAVIDVKGIKDAVLLRQIFGVSSQALNVRLKTLGYIL